MALLSTCGVLCRVAWLRCLATLLLLLAAPRAVCVDTASPPTLEYQVKAAFLLNFPKFIQWPTTAFEDASSPIAICILGNDPFGATLDHLVEGETVNGRKLVVRRIHHSPAPKSCQVLFIGSSEPDASKVLAGTGPGVLTVGDGEDFLGKGGIIAFIVENRRVRFDISQAAAARASLVLSSRLLNVARSVEK